ncbi:acyltransferase [Vibrio rarus]|uniref:acyltransferase n=1 Tax=Vibrio rarus TaxID=413403 RepID=UPI0021C41AD0|nr:acyltransferase [Vibrio rarus]
MHNFFTGRSITYVLHPFIFVLSSVLRVLPLCFRMLFFEIFKNFPTKIGVFIRLIILKSMCRCGNNIYIASNVTIKGFEQLTLDDNISIHENCYLDAKGGLDIGSDVSIAHNSSIITFEHMWSDQTNPIKYNNLELKSISIGSDVWIGCGSRILAGSRLSDRTIVAAGCVVNNVYDSNVIIAGIPSKVLKEI